MTPRARFVTRWSQALDGAGNPWATVHDGRTTIGRVQMVPVYARGESGRRWQGQGAEGGITALYHEALDAVVALVGNRWLVPPAAKEVN